MTLQTRDAGELEVTVDEVHDPAELTSEFAETSTATRHLAVELTVANPGGDTYDDHVGVNSTLVDTDDVAHDTAIDDVAECDRNGDVTISAGDQRSGCVVFEIDDTRDPRALQYQTGTDLGEWDLS